MEISEQTLAEDKLPMASMGVDMSRKGKLVYFATSNMHKFEEARLVLGEYGIGVAKLNVKGLEIQADDLEEIARTAVTHLTKTQSLPTLVEDAALFVKALNGFPGPYSSYVLRTIGNEGLLRLMQNVSDRRAEFKSAVAFCAPNIQPKSFQGVVEGSLSPEARGTHGFGFDPIFVPSEGDGRTFAEMETEEKNKISHRARAMRAFAKWYLELGALALR
jgi:XTP/dITP diphosphohydrolase